MSVNYSNTDDFKINTIVKNCIRIINDPEFKNLRGEEQFKNLKNAYHELKKSDTEKSYNFTTNLLHEANEKRLFSYSVLTNSLKALINNSSDSNYSDAVVILKIIEKYEIYKNSTNYNNISLQINQLLLEFEMPENKEKISKLSLNSIHTELKIGQAAFRFLYNEISAKENDTLSSSKLTKSIKLETVFNDFILTIYQMKENPKWDELYFRVSNLLKN